MCAKIGGDLATFLYIFLFTKIKKIQVSGLEFKLEGLVVRDERTTVNTKKKLIDHMVNHV
jgi:hypothetical protein